MKTSIRHTEDHGIFYDAIMYVCPGCIEMYPGSTGLHRLPVNSKEKNPAWDWDGNREVPTLSPSILTKHWRCVNGNFTTCSEQKPCEKCAVDSTGTRQICHSFLKAGVIEYLGDCTHSLAGQHVSLPDLPTWVEEM